MSESITLRLPSKYVTSNPSPSTFTPPPLDFLHRTWSVTHSTLPMWRTARNVRITYSPFPSGDTTKVSDLVEYETLSGSSLKNVKGVDTVSPLERNTGAWDWRGSGLLFFVSSHWEVLGWGTHEETGEKWVVTWFQKTIFSAEGVDVYSDRKEGGSEGLVRGILEELNKMPGELGELCKRDMRGVRIELPWVEK
ncbi:hypothetical protein QBC35DRAFT_476996 [Podospora australis]|uniref:Uncharacterized protein n=1 Tax=Podospora australis TaxID=1536484 RepID=A0AAN7AEY5_9PEZI|nr:hypothetical protein QBC35DRAFT_476996 [Podospora australis]